MPLTVVALMGRLAFDRTAMTASGAVLLVGAAALNSVRCRRAEAPLS